MPKQVKIAIVGAGPGGLAAAINLSRLPYVELDIFDQAKELREIGAGISINENTWRHLKLLGAAESIDQYLKRGLESVVDVEHRNGRTGEVLARKYQSVDPDKPARSRIERYRLQKALLERVPKDAISLDKKLAAIIELPSGVSLSFKDGTEAGPYDLVIGADGIRSVVRQHAFPSHKLAYTGKVAYRTLIPQSAVSHIPDLPRSATFWHTPKTHVYTDFLDNGLFEIATRALESEEAGAKVSWGQTVKKDKVIHHYNGYCDAIKQVIAAPDEWLEFAIFGGSRLKSVIKDGRIALLGDASHPLSGAFGSGAAFAFEDAYVLAQAIDYTNRNGFGVNEALRLYDEVRSPHYEALYEILNGMGNTAKEVQAIYPTLNDDDLVAETVRRSWNGDSGWIYKYDVTKVWADRIAEEDLNLSKLNLEEAKISRITVAQGVAVAA